jgi:hypothetical protein
VPNYYFQLPGQLLSEREGFDLPSLEEARRVAARTACAMISQNVDEFWAGGEWQMSVTDEDGLVLFSLTFFATDAAAAKPIEIHVGPPPTS